MENRTKIVGTFYSQV